MQEQKQCVAKVGRHEILKTLLKSVDDFIKMVCNLMLGVMAFAIFLQVFFRFIGRPLSWTEELSRYLMIWTAFMAASSMVRNWENVGVDFFLKKMAKAMRNLITVLIKAIVLMFLGFVFYLSVRIFPTVGWYQMTPALGIRMFWAQLGMVVGLGLMCLQLIGLLLIEPLRNFGGDME
jgi:TRAP-type C4-dicarboxylate transport system permease small subunit